MHSFRVLASAVFVTASTCLLASPALRPPVGNVLVVDASGSGQFTTIQAAVDAAVDGDVLLVRTGSYSAFLITNKALTVVGDVGAVVEVQGSVRLHHLDASKTVVLANLRNVGIAAYGNEELSTGLFVSDALGHVRVQDCIWNGGTGPTGNAVTVRASADVSLVACTLRGGARTVGTSCNVPHGGLGLSGQADSTVTVYGCSSSGGDGWPGGCSCDGGDGGHGGDVSQTTLFSSNSSFHGADGGDSETSSYWACAYGGAGGHGIRSSSSLVRLLATQTLRGQPGDVVPGCGECGYVGYAGYDRIGATFEDVPGAARGFVAPTPVLGGATELLTLRGQPGDRVELIIADATASAQYVAAWHGVLLVPLRLTPLLERRMIVGTVPGNGVIHFPLEIPALGASTSSRALFLQALFTDTQGQRYLSGARSLTILP